jgi:hypothetical protein
MEENNTAHRFPVTNTGRIKDTYIDRPDGFTLQLVLKRYRGNSREYPYYYQQQQHNEHGAAIDLHRQHLL